MRLKWLHQMTLADVEIGWHGKRVDLAYLSPNASVGPVAIELKVDSTKRAITQASLNRMMTPHSWVATYTPPSAVTRAQATKAGVGLLLVLDRGVYPIQAPGDGKARTSHLDDFLRTRGRRVRDLLGELRHEA